MVVCSRGIKECSVLRKLSVVDLSSSVTAQPVSMAPMERKRRRKDEHSESKKKRKVEQGDAGKSKPESNSATTILQTLPWHEVPFPENFEDAEGFFGLEEISDVEVVKDSGKVEYKVRQRSNGARTHDHGRGSQGEDDEWEGFGENDVLDTRPLKPETKLSSKSYTETDVKDSKRPKKKGNQKLLEQNQDRNNFDALGDGDEGDYDSDRGDMSAWDSLGLCPEIISSLAHLKFHRPTPIQTSALPHIFGGHDAICKAPTGSGKTLAFGIPIYEHLTKTRKTPRPKSKTKSGLSYDPSALILSPTRELAHQLADHLQQLGSGLDSSPGVATLTGGLSMHKQERLLPAADIIIGTPGRLKEVMDGNPALAEALRKIKFLVLDEADRLLGTGHFQELEEILNALDRTKATDEAAGDGVSGSSSVPARQTLVFSATLQKDLQQKLAGKSKSSGVDPSGQASMEYLLKKLNFKEQKPRFIDINPGMFFFSVFYISMQSPIFAIIISRLMMQSLNFACRPIETKEADIEPFLVSQMASGLKESIIECPGTEKVCEGQYRAAPDPWLRIIGPLPLLITPPPSAHAHFSLCCKLPSFPMHFPFSISSLSQIFYFGRIESTSPFCRSSLMA